MASANGTVCVITLDDKFLGMNGIVANIEEARLIDIVRNGRFTGSKETAKKYGINISKFKEISFKEVAPSYEEQFGYPRDYSGYFKGLSYATIRNLCRCEKVLKDGLQLSNNEPSK